MKKLLLVLPMLLAMVGMVFACSGEDCSETTFNLDVEADSDVSISTFVGTYDTEINTNLDVYGNEYTYFSQDAYVEDCYKDGWLIDTWDGQVNENQYALAYGDDIDYSRDIIVYGSDDDGWFSCEDSDYYAGLEASTSNSYFDYAIEGSGYSNVNFNALTNEYINVYAELDYEYNGWCFLWGCK